MKCAVFSCKAFGGRRRGALGGFDAVGAGSGLSSIFRRPGAAVAWLYRRPWLGGVESGWFTTDGAGERSGASHQLAATYEDHVLGKLYADGSFACAAETLRRYENQDQARGLAFLLARFKERSGFDGVLFSPGVLKGLLETSPDDLSRQGWESFRQSGIHELNEALMRSLIVAARRHNGNVRFRRRGRRRSRRCVGGRSRTSGSPPSSPSRTRS